MSNLTNKPFMIRSITLLSFFLFSIQICFSQSNNPCDSLKKKKELKTSKSYKKSESGINIIIDNSNDANNSITQEKPESIVNSKEIPNDNFDWNEVYKNAITILLGLVAAFIALYQAKSNIISSARIRWIEDLKSLLSEFYSVTIDVLSAYENYTSAKKNENDERRIAHYTLYDSHSTKFNALVNKIKMQLNSDEIEHRNIEKAVEHIDTKLCIENIKKATQNEIEEDLKEIITNSKIIFKKEWEKSKKLFKI